ncbi:MAG: PAS domain-containing sensor histidine kinase, partial [Mesorhizobium sp.]
TSNAPEELEDVRSVATSFVRVTVHDTGCGMSKDILAQVFEPFFTTKGEGTGLGLSQVYGFIKQSGGHIRIESAVGAGTSVHL